jgi:hypothetical protein
MTTDSHAGAAETILVKQELAHPLQWLAEGADYLARAVESARLASER